MKKESVSRPDFHISKGVAYVSGRKVRTNAERGSFLKFVLDALDLSRNPRRMAVLLEDISLRARLHSMPEANLQGMVTVSKDDVLVVQCPSDKSVRRVGSALKRFRTTKGLRFNFVLFGPNYKISVAFGRAKAKPSRPF